MQKFIDALGLLTTLPLWGLRNRWGGEVSDPALGSVAGQKPELAPGTAAFFPAVGLLLGILLFLGGRVALLLWSPKTTAVLLVLGWVLLTGGLHLDGLSDTLDGLGGGNTRERRLRIMKDSRIGTFGALALILALLTKYAFLAELEQALLFPILVCIPGTARAIMMGAMFFFPSARPGGMGAFFKKGLRRKNVLQSWALMGGLVFILSGPAGLLLCLGAAVLGWLFAFSLDKLQGGLTGDSYGALCEVSEIILLAGFTACQRCITFPFWRIFFR